MEDLFIRLFKYIDNSKYINLTTSKYYLEIGPSIIMDSEIFIVNDLGENQYYNLRRFKEVTKEADPIAWELFS
jgi:hypothetical protein